MSLLSQFFPSGSGGIAASQKVELLVVAGGGGAGASGGCCLPANNCASCMSAMIGGGGGGGQVVFSDEYEILQDVSYPITVGAGGAGGGFYYDTTNVYYPQKCINNPRPVNCYPISIQNKNVGTLRGSNGGNTVFGSVVAYGGGGGGGAMSAECSYLPTVCQAAAYAVCPSWTAKGASAGTGGGSGSGFCGTGQTVNAVSPAPDVRPGKAVHNLALSTLKFGAPGIDFVTPSCWPTIQCGPIPAPCINSTKAFSLLTYATGGGGNNAATGVPVAGAPICLVTPVPSVACLVINSNIAPRCDARTNCPGGEGFYSFACPGTNQYGAVNAFMEGNIGTTENYANQFSNNNDFLSTLRGGDGHLTQITPSPEYYGGGGGVAYASGCFNCATIFGAIITPNSPCYPSPVWNSSPAYTWLTCPYGGAGGGGAICTSLITSPTTVNCYRCTIVQGGGTSTFFPGTVSVGVCRPQCGSDLPVPGCICPGAGQAACGGGGASFFGGNSFTSTGPVFPNAPADPGGADTCAFCGYAGGSGTVVIRYPTVFSAATVTGNTPITPQSGYHVYRYNGPGTITFPSS